MRHIGQRATRRPGIVAVATILVSVCSQLCGACGWPPQVEVKVLPNEEIEIRLFGSWCNSCVPHVWQSEVLGNEIRLDLAHIVGICLPVGTPWEDTATFGSLPPGCYRIVAALYGVGNPMDPPFLQEEPTELTILCRPAVTRITEASNAPFFSLSWEAIGEGCVYTVESTDDVSAPSWAPLPPVDQWPIEATSWTDPTAAGAWAFPGRRFYRVRAEPKAAEGE